MRRFFITCILALLCTACSRAELSEALIGAGDRMLSSRSVYCSGRLIGRGSNATYVTSCY